MIPNSIPIASDSYSHRQMIVPIALVLVIVCFHFLFLMLFYEPAVSSADGYGYMAQARAIGESGRTFIMKESPVQFVGPHFSSADGRVFHSQYPPGYPLILAMFRKIGGPDAVYIVNPLLASFSVLLLYYVCRAFTGSWAALFASVMLALNPVANRHALMGDSHTSALFVLLLAVLAVLRWDESKSWLWLFVCGFLAGVIPLIRYAEVVMAPAFCVFIFFKGRVQRSTFRLLGVWLAGFSVPVLLLMFGNRMAFGSVFSTGYDSAHGGISFGVDYFLSYAPQYLGKLGGEGVGPLFGFGVAGVALMLVSPGTRRTGLFLGALAVPVTLLYMAYFWRPDMMSMRFLMLTFPVYCIAGAWLLARIGDFSRSGGIAVGFTLLLISLMWGMPESLSGMRDERDNNAVLARLAECVAGHVGEDDIVVAGMKAGQHLDSIGRWKMAAMPENNRRGRRPPFMMNQREDDHGFPSLTGGIYGRRNGLTGSEWRDVLASWAGEERTVYFVCTDDEYDSLLDVLEEDELVVLEEVSAGDSSGNVPDFRDDMEPPRMSPPDGGMPSMGGQTIMRRGAHGPMGAMADHYYLLEWVR